MRHKMVDFGSSPVPSPNPTTSSGVPMMMMMTMTVHRFLNIPSQTALSFQSRAFSVIDSTVHACIELMLFPLLPNGLLQGLLGEPMVWHLTCMCEQPTTTEDTLFARYFCGHFAFPCAQLLRYVCKRSNYACFHALH
jgi:hypothetical protein